jgi:phage terminase Nu1 subunit (DNA packaging protein)
LSASEFAALCGVSVQAVTNWTREGMPHSGGGRQGARTDINLSDAVPWVVARRDAQPLSQRDRFQTAKAEQIEMENALRRGQLVDAIVVAEVLKAIATNVSAQLEAISPRCANEFAGVSDAGRIRERLREEHHAVRATLAQVIGRLAESCERVACDVAAMESAAAENAGPVGGRESNTAEGQPGAGTVSQSSDAVDYSDRPRGRKRSKKTHRRRAGSTDKQNRRRAHERAGAKTRR